MDIWDKAHEIVVDRLRNKVGLFGDTHFTDQLPERTDDGETTSPFLRVKVRVKEPDGPRWSRAQMYEHLLEQNGPRCQGCDRTFDDPRYLQLDHNTPRSDGGLNHISNRILLCGPCNGAKSNIYTRVGVAADQQTERMDGKTLVIFVREIKFDHKTKDGTGDVSSITKKVLYDPSLNLLSFDPADHTIHGIVAEGRRGSLAKASRSGR